MSEEKIYCGNGKVIKTQYGDLMKLSFTEEDLGKLKDSLSNGWVNVVVKERREPSEKGTTHYLEVDTWKPDGKGSDPSKKQDKKDFNPDNQSISADDLPF